MKKLVWILGLFCSTLWTAFASAQTTANPKMRTYKVGIFAPLYLDSVFNASGAIRIRETMPKFIAPGLEFVHGAQIALDSMKCWGENYEAYIFDTKSYTQPIPQLIKLKKLDSLDLIIGSVKDFEYRQLADFAGSKHIPFVSATLPNDGGITNNPYLVIVNSTLKAHCEAIYSYILQNHGTDNIFLIRQKGTQEDRVASYFKSINEPDGKPLLKIQTIHADSTFSATVLKNKLDSNRQTIIIGGSLDETFAVSLTGACYALQKDYPITLLGMPNWDGFKGLVKKDAFEDFPIYFTTPYFNNKWDSYSKMVTNSYSKKYHGKPTDMAFKGFECTYLFCKLLGKFPGQLMSHLNDKTFKLYTDFNFRPVTAAKENLQPDYFENKHLYFIKILNGNTSKAW